MDTVHGTNSKLPFDALAAVMAVLLAVGAGDATIC
jgi:hypothetical protein